MRSLAHYARPFVALVFVAALGSPTGGCGARTALLEDGLEETDGDTDAPMDAPLDRSADRVVPDAPFDVPALDVVRPDVVDRTGCADASQTYVYFITADNVLSHFDPASNQTTRIGTIRCPGVANGDNPFSMAVDRRGIAYVLLRSGTLVRVSPSTAACTATPFQRNQQGFDVFGMGFSTDGITSRETLYVAADGRAGEVPGLGSIDVTTFRLSRVSSFVPRIEGVELTGTGDGRLFGFYKDDLNTNDSWIAEMDKRTGQVTSQDRLANLNQGSGWAFAFWGSDFYLFTAPGGTGRITRYRPADKSRVVVANLPTSYAVGAGVSTCAPQ